MQKRVFENGTIIKGKDLKGHILCKILSEDMIMKGFQYKIGMNVDVNQLALAGSCKHGLHFVLIQDICRYLNYGSRLAVVSIPDKEKIYVDYDKFRTHRLEFKEVMALSEVDTWRYLIENGADVTIQYNNAIRWAAGEGHLEVVKYLIRNGANAMVWDNEAFWRAAKGGYLDVVKYLQDNGAGITFGNSIAVNLAAEGGYLEVVKYLHENGADITAQNNKAVRWAARYGHLEVVKYLVENGADITVWNNEAIRMAAKGGHLDVVTYLAENGADIKVIQNG